MRIVKSGHYSLLYVGDEPHQKEWAEKTMNAVADTCDKLMKEAKESKLFERRAEAIVCVMNGIKNALSAAACNIILEGFPDDEEPEIGPIGTELANELHDVLQRHISEHTHHLYSGN